MAFTFAESFDGVTAPALPAGWTFDSQYVTSTTRSVSAPNSLFLSSGSSGTRYFGTYGTPDPGAGATVDVSLKIYIDVSANTGLYKAGMLIRGSSSTLDNTSTSMYWVNVAFNNVFSGPHVQFDKLVNGTITTLASVTNNDPFMALGTWYELRCVCAGSSTFNVTITRLSDGWTMDSGGNGTSATVPTISGLVATDIASGSYYGVCANGQTSGKIFMDSINVSGGAALVLPPRKPHVVPIPFRCYKPD